MGKVMIRRDANFLKEKYGQKKVTNELRLPEVIQKDKLVSFRPSYFESIDSQVKEQLKQIQFYAYRVAASYNELDKRAAKDIRDNVASVLRTHISKLIQSSIVTASESIARIANRCEEMLQTGNRKSLLQDWDVEQNSMANLESGHDILYIDKVTLEQNRERIKKDIEKIKNLSTLLSRVQPKVDAEKAQLVQSLFSKKAPTLVFTEYKNTARWLIDYYESQGVRVFPGKPDQIEISKELQDELLRLDPSTDSPRRNEAPSYEVYILTDKYSEGKNLHKCDTIINFDLPWSPIRKAQRQGRIVRLASPYEKVFIESISFESPALKEFADPERILKEKLRKISSLLGSGHNRGLYEDGKTFISCFVECYEKDLDLNQEKRLDTIGPLGDENKDSFIENIWCEILKGGYKEKAKEILKKWSSFVERQDQTVRLNGIYDQVFAVIQEESSNWRSYRKTPLLQWYKYEARSPQKWKQIEFEEMGLNGTHKAISNQCEGWEAISAKIFPTPENLMTFTQGSADSHKYLKKIREHLKHLKRGQNKDTIQIINSLNSFIGEGLDKIPVAELKSLEKRIKGLTASSGQTFSSKVINNGSYVFTKDSITKNLVKIKQEVEKKYNQKKIRKEWIAICSPTAVVYLKDAA